MDIHGWKLEMYIYKIEMILFLYFLCNLTMDPKAITSQLERNFTSINMLLAQQQKKIEELEQLAIYYKNRNTHLEADFVEMAGQLEQANLENARLEQAIMTQSIKRSKK